MSACFGWTLSLAPRPKSTADEKLALYEAWLAMRIMSPTAEAMQAKRMARPYAIQSLAAEYV